jgi:hypothetical protein
MSRLAHRSCGHIKVLPTAGLATALTVPSHAAGTSFL